LPAEAVITLRFLLFRQAGHHRVGAAQLKAVYRLAIFALHQNNVIEARREFSIFCSGVLHRFIDRRAQHRSEIFRPSGAADRVVNPPSFSPQFRFIAHRAFVGAGCQAGVGAKGKGDLTLAIFRRPRLIAARFLASRRAAISHRSAAAECRGSEYQSRSCRHLQ
jgi:hypothetical protein